MKFKIKEKIFDCSKKPLIMGILNLTPDSFYDGAKYSQLDSALIQVEKIIAEGADIIDIGGESTRPGSEKVEIEEELQRVIPVLKKIKRKFGISVSVDTYKSEIAEASLDEGAEIINDISGLKFDTKMAEIISKYNASTVLMHIKDTPGTMQDNPEYDDVINEIKKYLQESIQIAVDNGIKFDNIIIDPGIGFGKNVEDNYKIIKQINEFNKLNRPVLIGLSRKSLIGKVLNNKVEERLSSTVLLNAISIMNGAGIIRVHDVKEHRDMIKLLEIYKKV